MKIHRLEIPGSDGERIQLKYLIPDKIVYESPVVISHGFKGFMDWGHFPLVGEKIAERGHVVVMFNYSHNGTSSESPSDFVRLDLFAKNTYSRELFDLDKVLDEVEKSEVLQSIGINGKSVTLIGHSRGGGIAITKTAKDARIQKMITWASIGSFGAFFGQNIDMLEQWKTDGVMYTYNARTGQQMPLNYSLYEDVLSHPELNIYEAASKINVPWLIIHGEDDPTVPVSVAHHLKSIQPNATLFVMEEAHHNFGGKHPLDDTADFEQINLLAQKTIEFIEK